MRAATACAGVRQETPSRAAADGMSLAFLPGGKDKNVNHSSTSQPRIRVSACRVRRRRDAATCGGTDGLAGDESPHQWFEERRLDKAHGRGGEPVARALLARGCRGGPQ